MKSSGAELVVNGATFEDGVGMVRALRKANYTPDWFYQTTAPSLGDQYAKAVGEGTTEGIFYGVSHSKEADTPGNQEFVAKYQELYGGTEVPEDAADAYAAAQVMQAAVEAVGTVERDQQIKLADWLRENEVETILGPAELGRAGTARGRVPGRSVAERGAGDRAAGRGGHQREDHSGVAAEVAPTGERRRGSWGCPGARPLRRNA